MKTLLLFLTITVFTYVGVYAQPTGNYITMISGNDNVYIPHASYWNLSGDFTISMNLNFSNTNYWQMLMTHSPYGFELSFTGSQLWLSPTGFGLVLQAAWSPQAYTWYHLVVTRSGGTISAYVDGQLIGTGGGSIGTSSSSPLRLGNYYVNGYAFYGSMDEVSMWNTGATQSYVTTVLANPLTGNEAGLVAYWKLDETGAGAGITVDNAAQLTGNALDGVTQGTATTPYFTSVPTPENSSLCFDGQNDFVKINNSASLNPGPNASMTIEIWAKLPDNITAMPIIAKRQTTGQYPQISLFKNGPNPTNWQAGKRILFVYQESTTSTRICYTNNDIADGNWHHIATVADYAADILKIYVDGVLQPVTTYYQGNWPDPSTSEPYYLGYANDPNGILYGSLKDVRIWKTARSQSLINQYMFTGIPNPAGETNLVAYYPCNEASGQVLTDHSSYSNNGQLGSTAINDANDPVWCSQTLPSPVQNCLDFDGVNDYVNVGNQPAFAMNTTMTIEAWIYPQGPGSGGSGGSGGMIVSKEGEYEITRIDNGNIGWAISNSYPGWSWVQTTAFVPLNEWSHVALTYDGVEVKTYINGVLKHSYGAWGPIIDVAPTYNDLWISGRQTVANGQIFDGKMDEVRIWNTVRTEAQIRENAHRELPNPESLSGLVGYYRFNNTSGLIVNDYSSNACNGAMTNMDSFTDWESSTAPIPFNTIANGTWENNATWNTGQNAPVNAWSRVKVDHNVTLNSPKEAIDVTITSTGTLNVNQAQALTVTSDLVNQNGINGLVLKSGASGTATLIENDGVVATVERYFSGNDVDWHLVSSPVSNAKSNVFTGMYLQRFDEAANQYVEIIPGNVNLNPVRGYAAYSTLSNDNTVAFKGNLNKGNLSLPVTHSATTPYGWNLVGNPYASSIDWNLVIPTLSNIGSTIYYLEAATGNWLTWNGTTGSGSQYIPPMQGFFVSASTNTTFSLSNSARTHNGSGIFYKDEIPYLAVIKASGNGFEDKTYIQFSETASADFDLASDGYKIISDINPLLPQVFTIANGKNLSINTLPFAEIVPLSFLAGTSGSYDLSLAEATDITVLILEDKKTGTFTDLTKSNYSFAYSVSDNPYRFNLHFTPLSVGGNLIDQMNIYAERNQVYINASGISDGTVTIYDMLGQPVLSGRLQQNIINAYPMHASTGFYLVKVTSVNNVTTRKIFLH
jgi:hypothetical protein